MLHWDLSCVSDHRRRLGKFRPRYHPLWSPAQDALVGTGPDKEIAARLGRPVAALRFRREQLGRPPCNPKWKPWTKEEKALLGTMTDAEVAVRTGHPVLSVKKARWQVGIPCFK